MISATTKEGARLSLTVCHAVISSGLIILTEKILMPVLL